MEMYAYDIEVFRNFALFIFVDISDYFKIRAELEGANVNNFEAAILKAKKHVFIIGHGYNDIMQLVSFVNRNVIFASFNGLDYDDIIINACIAKVNYWKTTDYINDQLYKLSKKIISNQNAKIFNDQSVNVYKRMRTLYKSVDVQKVFGLNKVFKSLKQMLINLKWYNIEDYAMPPMTKEERGLYTANELYLYDVDQLEDWDRFVLPHHLEGLSLYCLNDALGVGETVYQKTDAITLRFDISDEYQVNVLSSSESNIADRIFGKLYCEASGMDFNTYRKGRTPREFVYIGECLPPNIKFTSKVLRELHNQLRTTVIRETKGELNFKVTYNDTIYDLKTGGLHSRDTPGKFVNSDKSKLIDADATAYYPINVWNNKISPAHLDADIFTTTTKVIVDDRVESKPNGKNPNKIRDKTLKITINSGIFGKMGFPDSPVFDPKAMVSVTIGCQLYLLMLIERLEDTGFKIISANTDGIIAIVDRDREETYYDICKQWMKDTNFDLEYTYYDMYVRSNVNHYMAVKTGDSPVDKRIKYKGTHNPNLYKEDLRKGYNKPIVAMAVKNFYIHGTAIMDTLQSCTDIMDFCVTQKSNKKYKLELHHVLKGKPTITKLSKNIRFYISKNVSSLKTGLLLKNDTTVTDVGNRKHTNIVSGRIITMFNKRIDYDDISKYNLDYGYYYTEAKKIISAIDSNSKIKKVIKKEYGQYKMGF